MTAPGFRYPDWDAQLGIGSDVDKREWEIFLQRRKELADSIAGRVQMQGMGFDQQTTDTIANATEQAPGGIAWEKTQPPASSFELEKLIGAAEFYGIQGARQLPPHRLKMLVEARRLSTQQEMKPTSERGALRNIGDTLLEGAAVLGLGTTNSLLRSVTKVPFLGDWVQRNETAQASQRWFGELEEGVRASLPDDYTLGHRVGYGAGGMLGYTLPAAAAYRAIGMTGAVAGYVGMGSRMSPLVKAGLTELGTAWALEGGGDESIGERAKNMAWSAGFGVAMRGLPYVARWAREKFRPGSGPVGGEAGRTGTAPWGRRAGMEGEVVGTAPGLAPGPRQALSSGELGTPIPGTAPTAPIPGQRALPPPQPARLETGAIETPYAPQGGAGEIVPEFQINPSNVGNRGNLLPSPQQADLAALRIQNQDLRTMQRTDHMTGLGNQASMMASRPGVDADDALSWIVYDGSRFKSVNDTFGHDAGDDALRYFGNALRQTAAEMGVPARLFRGGGDEFFAAVPREVAEQFRTRSMELSQLDFPAQGNLPAVTTKLDGVAAPTWAEAESTLNELKRARKAAGLDSRSAVPAGNVATGMTKEATLIESPIINQVVRESDLDDSTIARAVAANYPGQIGIVQGIGDPASLIKGIELSRGNGQLKDPQYRIVEVGGPPKATKQELADAGYFESEYQYAEHPKVMAGYAMGPGAQLRPVDEQVIAGMRTGRAQTEATRAAQLAQIEALEKSGQVTSYGGQPSLTSEQASKIFGADTRGMSVAEARNFATNRAQESLRYYEGMERAHQKWLAAAQPSVTPQPRLDLLISEGLPITDARVAQYKRYGMFEGQLATSAMGHEVRVVNPEGQFATVQSVYGGENYLVPRNMLYPGKSTLGGKELNTNIRAEATWQRFKQYATREMAREGERAGLPGFDWNDVEVSSQLPRLMMEFLNDMKLKPGQRMAMEAYFERARIKEYVDLAKEQQAVARNINNRLNTAVVRSHRYFGPIPVEDIAATKGWTYMAEPGGLGGTLVDRFSGERVETLSEADAIQFLRRFNRELPDESPAFSGVPFEAAPVHPMAANPGIELEPTIRGGEAQVLASTERMTAQFEEMAELGAVAPVHSITSPVVPPEAPAPAGVPDLPAPNQPNPPPAEQGAAPVISNVTPTPITPSSVPVPHTEPRPPAPPPAPPPPPRPPSGQSRVGRGPEQPRLPGGQPETLGAQFARLRKQKPAELHQALEEMDNVLLRWGAPFRSFMLQMQTRFQDVGASEAKAWKHYNDLSMSVTKSHNEAKRWHSEWTSIMTQFGRKKRRDGTVAKIEEIGDYNEKIAAMQAAGYTPREMAAQGRIRGFFDRMHGEANIANYIFNYVPRVRARQAAGVRDPYAENNLPRDVEFFAEFARTGNMQMRQMDMGVLGTHWIRAWHFKHHVEPSWNQMVTAWDDPRVPDEIRGIVKNWLHIVRTGFQPQHDIAVQGARHALNRIGIPVTDSEMAGMWNTIFSNAYRGQLGGRPDAIFRDAISPLFTGTRIGMTPIIRAYTQFMKGGGRVKDAMWERAVKGGWVESGQVQSVNAESFTQAVTTETGQGLLTAEMMARREKFAQIGDFIHDMLPPAWRKGIQGSKFDPLFYYTKLGEFNRLISGEAGWQEATRAISEYHGEVARVGLGTPDMRIAAGPANLDKAMAKLMKDSRARLYRRPIQDEFKRLIQAGDNEGAANLMANEAANMQFRYGQRESSVGMQTAGTTGRMGMMFGSFSQQFASYTKESLAKHVPIEDKAKFLARYGAVMGTLGIAGAYTGWNFGKWMWHQSLTFAGGPMLGAIAGTANLVTGFLADRMGAYKTKAQAEAQRTFNPGGMLRETASFLNPYNSTMETIGKYGQAATSLAPIENTLRTTVMGDPSNREIWQRTFGASPSPDPDQLNRAILGDIEARKLFPKEDLPFLDQLRKVPQEQRWRIWAARRDSMGRTISGAGAMQ